jgi:hypothetical protein
LKTEILAESLGNSGASMEVTPMDFIERLFHVAPDHGNGTLEVFILSAILAVPLAYAALRTIAAIRRSRSLTHWRRPRDADGSAARIRF